MVPAIRAHPRKNAAMWKKTEIFRHPVQTDKAGGGVLGCRVMNNLEKC